MIYLLRGTQGICCKAEQQTQDSRLPVLAFKALGDTFLGVLRRASCKLEQIVAGDLIPCVRVSLRGKHMVGEQEQRLPVQRVGLQGNG